MDLWWLLKHVQSVQVGGMHPSGCCLVYLFYPWVMCILTVRITEAFGLPKPCLFCNVQRNVASLPSYSKLNSNSSHMILS